MDRFGLIEAALYGALTNDAQLSALIGTNAFDTQAPAGAAGDYVVYQFIVGGPDNQSPRDVQDVQYRVEYISQTQNSARVGAGHIDRILHNGDISAYLGTAGWSVYRSRAYRQFNQVENLDGRQWYRKGAFYRIQVSKQG